MGDIACCSIEQEYFLYQLFGVNAERLIDHAWGWEPVTMDLVKAYRPETSSLSSGQVLQSPYTVEQTRNVVKEMADSMALDLVGKRLVTDQIVLTIGYDVTSLTDPTVREKYHGKVTTDHYGRQVPVHVHGTTGTDSLTSSAKTIIAKTEELFDRIVNPDLLIRRLTLCVNHLIPEAEAESKKEIRQLDLFTDYKKLEQERQTEREKLALERHRQEAILHIKQMFGKNAILRGMNFADGATQKERNQQIGSHYE